MPNIEPRYAHVCTISYDKNGKYRIHIIIYLKNSGIYRDFLVLVLDFRTTVEECKHDGCLQIGSKTVRMSHITNKNDPKNCSKSWRFRFFETYPTFNTCHMVTASRFIDPCLASGTFFSCHMELDTWFNFFTTFPSSFTCTTFSIRRLIWLDKYSFNSSRYLWNDWFWIRVNIIILTATLMSSLLAVDTKIMIALSALHVGWCRISILCRRLAFHSRAVDNIWHIFHRSLKLKPFQESTDSLACPECVALSVNGFFPWKSFKRLVRRMILDFMIFQYLTTISWACDKSVSSLNFM